MCIVDRLHIKAKQKGNKLDSNHYKDLPPAFIDDYIYDAMFDYVELFWSGKNYKGYNLGFEVNSQRIDMLSFLIKTETLTGTSQPYGNLTLNVYTLPEDYLHRVREKGEGECSGLKIKIVQHEDLDRTLSDEYKRPSNKWSNAVGVYRDSQLYVYSETVIPTIEVQYIKKPVKTFIGGYDTLEFLNGNITYPSQSSLKVDSEFPEQYCDILIDIMIQNVFGDMKDYNEASYRQQKIINKTF